MASRSPYALTTAIGSLPHHNADAAIQYAFEFDVPFLPQIPQRDRSEYMLAQALDGLPGLHVDEDGSVMLDVPGWKTQAKGFDQQLDEIIAVLQKAPLELNDSADLISRTSRCWRPFLFEAQERKVSVAKVQLAGPLTCQWALTLTDGSKVSAHPELGAQIFKLVFAKALTLVQSLVSRGVQPIIFLDEPGLYAFSSRDPQHMLAMHELKLLISALKKTGARVGLHCCSNTDWKAVLDLGISILSFDVALSLESLLGASAELRVFLEGGGALSLGVVPTDRELADVDHHALFQQWAKLVERAFGRDTTVFQQAMRHSFLTPACGLGLKSVEEAEAILSRLKEVQTDVRALAFK